MLSCWQSCVTHAGVRAERAHAQHRHGQAGSVLSQLLPGRHQHSLRVDGMELEG
jgi:hypothetical protein